MKTSNPDPWITILAGSKSSDSAITVRDYSEMHRRQDRKGIADLILLRFTERYLDPILDSPKRHGFAILAIGCLMVEALESFRNGWENTSGKGKSEAAFHSFFRTHDEFAALRPVAHDFYRAVRCGILHQAETTDNWRVHRKAGLFSENGGVRRLSAFEFGKGLKSALNRYHEGLVNTGWNEPVWIKTRKRLQAICLNCGIADSDVSKLA